MLTATTRPSNLFLMDNAFNMICTVVILAYTVGPKRSALRQSVGLVISNNSASRFELSSL